MRVRQVKAHRASLPPPVIPTPLRALLSDDAHARFVQLTPADQRHLIDVATRLAGEGASTELVTAGLLHDIGKAVPGTPIRIIDRIVYVMLPAAARAWIGNRPATILTGGIVALYHHAEASADLATAWGYPERVVWLIRHHERRDLHDDQLKALIAADDASDGMPTQ
jgi:HD-like signal output (HDOD) protein